MSESTAVLVLTETVGATVVVTGATVLGTVPIGPQGPQGDPGADSTVPGPQGDPGPAGEGVPTGGTAGQVLTKDSGTDYDTSWQTPIDPLTQTEGDARYWPLSTDLATQVELNSEATTRGNADTALDARLDAIEALGSLATDAELAAEAATRAAADTALDGRVDALEAAGPYVESVVAGTNVTVDNSDPANPVVSASGGGGSGVVESVVAGDGVSVDDTDPANPVVTAEVTQTELDAETSARTAADSALDTRVDALEAVDPLTQTEGDARYWQLATDLATQAELDTVAGTIPNTEAIQDVVGGMVSGGTETGISVSYDDTNGRLDFVAEVTQAELDTEASTRAAADSALDARLDTVEAEKATIVNTDGDPGITIYVGSIDPGTVVDGDVWIDPTTFDGVEEFVEVTGLTGAVQASRWVGGTSSGAPVTGTFSTGDFIVDRSGSVWVCTAGGSPGTWVDISKTEVAHKSDNTTDTYTSTATAKLIPGMTHTGTMQARAHYVHHRYLARHSVTVGGYWIQTFLDGSAVDATYHTGSATANTPTTIDTRHQVTPATAGSHTVEAKILLVTAGTVSTNPAVNAPSHMYIERA